ncbi:hypothetical protein [Deinococcus misasensis]|uniref:hypothetical protein n=1 Tax=Deinococcus misasensis TaxID=392413 RepID=UPI0005509757|nr:hypothetical protein [Deinococcus misasensis]
MKTLKKTLVMTALSLSGMFAVAQSTFEVKSPPVKASAYGIAQVPARIAASSNLPVKLTVVNDGQSILHARYSGCFVDYEVRDRTGKPVAKANLKSCLTSGGGFSVLNQADYPFLEPFMVGTRGLARGEYSVVVTLLVDGKIGSRPVKKISTAPVKFVIS